MTDVYSSRHFISQVLRYTLRYSQQSSFHRFMHTRKVALLMICVLWMLVSGCYAAVAAEPQTRCGWFDNPTPGNAWLHDRDGEWTIAIQGGYEAQGDWPQFKDSQWVSVNRSYGYGCACIKAIVNAKTSQIVSIISANARPLSACRKDRALKEPAD
jgi:hypothetical protein